VDCKKSTTVPGKCERKVDQSSEGTTDKFGAHSLNAEHSIPIQSGMYPTYL